MRTAEKRRAYLEKVAALGAAGIKIDFIPPCTPEVTRWYEGALKDTAELHLLCDFHGSVKPTGRRRTWPQELTREAVRGLEYHITRYKRVQAPEHDEIVPFTRLLAGPADYTPTTLNPKELGNYSKAHMLAQSVVMTSPQLCFGGGYKETRVRRRYLVPVMTKTTRRFRMLDWPCSSTGRYDSKSDFAVIPSLPRSALEGWNFDEYLSPAYFPRRGKTKSRQESLCAECPGRWVKTLKMSVGDSGFTGKTSTATTVRSAEKL